MPALSELLDIVYRESRHPEGGPPAAPKPAEEEAGTSDRADEVTATDAPQAPSPAALEDHPEPDRSTHRQLDDAFVEWSANVWRPEDEPEATVAEVEPVDDFDPFDPAAAVAATPRVRAAERLWRRADDDILPPVPQPRLPRLGWRRRPTSGD